MNDWDKELHSKLRRLPSLKAPAALLPAVMERLEARTRWAWWAWPAPARAFSLLTLAAGAGELPVAGGRLWARLPAASSSVVSRAFSALASAHNGVSTALARSLWEVLAAFAQPLLVPVLLMYLLCAAGAIIVWQLSLRPRHLRHI